ncbi:MAG: patatin [Alteromonadaceae bacterium]|nr:MAG: patatin [Alteromonadaceae bacterium]
MINKNRNLALALSGGGVRAMVFHAGALLYLSENGYLEKVSEISSVSGGSLLVGLIYQNNECTWPTSGQYRENLYGSIRELLCSKDLQFRTILALLNPVNWRYFFSRANLVAKMLEKTWGIQGYLSDIGSHPVWSINGTTAENGRRFRFKHDTFGDYLMGYSDASDFKLSQAVAMSAAFPGGIGPLAIKTNAYTWKKRKSWNNPEGEEVVVLPPFKKIHIYDGGVYDNLGTESLFDPGKGVPKKEHTTILVSDAGSPFSNTFSMNPLNPFRLKRILDICMDQSRALRVRSFMSYLQGDKKLGGYLMIGQNPNQILSKEELKGHCWQTHQEIKLASQYKTTLSKISTTDFDRISRHGYEMAKSIDIIKKGLF